MKAESPDALLLALGEAIRARRHALGLTLKEVQATTGLGHSFLSKIERGLARPSMRSLTTIADVLGTTAHTLMALSGPPETGGVQRGEAIEVPHGGGMARALVRGPWPFLPVEFRRGPRNSRSSTFIPGAR